MPEAAQQDAPFTVAEVESPIINSPFAEPKCHWKIEKAKPAYKAEGRRRASYFYRVPEHAGRGRANRDQAELFESQAGEEVELEIVNAIRARVKDVAGGRAQRRRRL